MFPLLRGVCDIYINDGSSRFLRCDSRAGEPLLTSLRERLAPRRNENTFGQDRTAGAVLFIHKKTPPIFQGIP